MSAIPTVSRITIYPVKSLDGIELQNGVITAGGTILHDREYAMEDADGNYINGKSNPLVHLLRTQFDLENEKISFRKQDEQQIHAFHLQKERSGIERYLSDFFEQPVTFIQDKTGRFMDMPDVAGLTVLSAESLQAVTEWFDPLGLDETRRRFRATIEISGVEAFWEDQLFSHPDTVVEFRIGDVTVLGMSPRARCVVPTRHTETAEVTHAFPKIFARHRAETLPDWSDLADYGHYYYLSVNCHVPDSEIGKWIWIGDDVKVIGEKSLI